MKKSKRKEKTKVNPKRKAKKDSSYSGLLKQKRVRTEDLRIEKFFFRSGKLIEQASSSFFLSSISKLGLSKKVTTPLKKSFARGVDQSRILNLVMVLLRSLLMLPMSFYGTGMLSFGLYAAIIQIVKVYIIKTNTINYFTLAIYVLTMIMAVPLLFMNKKTLSKAVMNSFILGLVFRHALGVPDESLNREQVKQVNLIGIFLVGMLFGLMTVWINPTHFLYGVLAFIFAAIVFFVPESGIMISIYTLPFVSPKYAAGIVVFTLFAYLHKLMRGKRVLKFVTADAFVFVFSLFILMGGVFSANVTLSKSSTLFLLCFVAEYFLIVNLIRNSEWLKRTVAAIIATATLVALVGIIEYVNGTFTPTLGNPYIVPTINYAMSSLENLNILSEILVLSFPFFLAATRSAKKAMGKILMFALLCIPFVCIIATFSRGAWLGLLVGIILFAILVNRKAIYVIAPFFAILALTVKFLPTSTYNFIIEYIKFSDASLSFRTDVWTGVVDMIKNNLTSGIGNGDGIFRTYYPMYALSGVENAANAHSLYLQLIVSVGVAGLIAFVLMIYFLFCTCTSFAKERKVKNTFHISVMICGVASICSILAQGALESVFYNYRVFLLFFIVAGTVIASGRCMQTEDYNSKPVTGPQATIIYKESKNKAL